LERISKRIVAIVPRFFRYEDWKKRELLEGRKYYSKNEKYISKPEIWDLVSRIEYETILEEQVF
jgi:hypothetical protein